jgi:hypothetical protein
MRWLAVLALVFSASGCGAATASNEPMRSPTPRAEASSSGCAESDLRLPSGGPVDLTGTWHGDDDAYWVVVQIGDCVWATATDEYLDGYWQVSLRGNVRTDFTVPVEFVYAGNQDLGIRGYGHAVLQIEITDAGGVERLSLRKIAGCDATGEPPCPPGETSLQTTVFSVVSTSVIVPAPTPGP